jgi:hypothetical protein
MGKRLIGGISILSVLMSLSLTPAHSATKAGAKCTKVGITSVVGSKTFTCIKSGKKLVWNKGITTQVIKPFVAWSTKFEINSLINSAIKSTDSYVGVVVPNNSYEIAIQNSVTETDRKWITGMLDYTNGFFSKIERSKLKIFLGNSHDWSKETVKNAGVWLGNPDGIYPCSNGTQDAYCAGYQNLVLLVYLIHYHKTPRTKVHYQNLCKILKTL